MDELETTLEVLANRVKMMRVRTAANHVKDQPTEPDPYKDPEAWRKAMNLKLRMRGN